MRNKVMQLWQVIVAMLVFPKLHINKWPPVYFKQLDNYFPFIPRYLITRWICSQCCQNHLTPVPHHLHMPGTQYHRHVNIKNLLMLNLHQYQPINCLKEKYKHLYLERGRGEVAYLFYYENK